MHLRASRGRTGVLGATQIARACVEYALLKRRPAAKRCFFSLVNRRLTESLWQGMHGHVVILQGEDPGKR